jgi:hypothetical protein
MSANEQEVYETHNGNELDHQGWDNDDDLRGNERDEHFHGGKGDDQINGGAGLDDANYTGNFSDYQIRQVNGALELDDSVAGRDGHDTLSNVERLNFADRKIAYDLDANQSAGKSALLVATCLGNEGLQNKQVIRAVIDFFDHQSSADLLTAIQLLESNGTIAQLAGGNSNADVVRWIGHNVLSNQFTAEIEHNCQTYTDSHGQADFIATVAAMGLNVDLVGLKASGLEFV